MNRNDQYNYAIFLAVIGWFAFYKYFLQSVISETVAGAVSIMLIILPILFLEVGIKLLVAGTPYLRASVRSPTGGYVLRLFLETYQETMGEYYNSAFCGLKWPTTSPDFGKFDTVKLIYYGSWSDNFLFKPGRAVWMGYEVGHPQTEDAVLYTLLQNSTITDHTDLIPVFFVKDASGHYRREMGLIPEAKPQSTKPTEPEKKVEPEPQPIEEEVLEEQTEIILIEEE